MGLPDTSRVIPGTTEPYFENNVKIMFGEPYLPDGFSGAAPGG